MISEFRKASSIPDNGNNTNSSNSSNSNHRGDNTNTTHKNKQLSLSSEVAGGLNGSDLLPALKGEGSSPQGGVKRGGGKWKCCDGGGYSGGVKKKDMNIAALRAASLIFVMRKRGESCATGAAECSMVGEQASRTAARLHNQSNDFFHSNFPFYLSDQHLLFFDTLCRFHISEGGCSL